MFHAPANLSCDHPTSPKSLVGWDPLDLGPAQRMFAKWRATDLMWEFGSEEAGCRSEPSEPSNTKYGLYSNKQGVARTLGFILILE